MNFAESLFRLANAQAVGVAGRRGGREPAHSLPGPRATAGSTGRRMNPNRRGACGGSAERNERAPTDRTGQRGEASRPGNMIVSEAVVGRWRNRRRRSQSKGESRAPNGCAKVWPANRHRVA